MNFMTPLFTGDRYLAGYRFLLPTFAGNDFFPSIPFVLSGRNFHFREKHSRMIDFSFELNVEANRTGQHLPKLVGT
jgi:hypothetical protein